MGPLAQRRRSRFSRNAFSSSPGAAANIIIIVEPSRICCRFLRCDGQDVVSKVSCNPTWALSLGRTCQRCGRSKTFDG